MDRSNRDARRATTVSTSMTPALSNGLPRRRHRTTLRDSLEEDGPLERPDTSRSGFRGRHVGGKKDQDRIERLDRLDRDRDRDGERLLRNKRPRGNGNNNHRLIHHGGPEELGMVAEESSAESVNDNEDEDDDEPNHQHHHQHHQHTRLLQPTSAVTSPASMMLNNCMRSYPPSASAMAAATGTTLKVTRPARKVADEMIGVSVPRKARSASAKRSHDCWVGGGATASGDQTLWQPSTSPARPGLAVASPVNNRPASPSSSNASARKKLKLNDPKQRPRKSVSKPVSSSATQDEIEIAEVLYGMMRQSQGPSSSKSEVSFGGEFVKTEVSRDENNKPTPISNSGSVLPAQNSTSSVPLMSVVAPKRKKPRAIKYDEEIQAQSMYLVRNSPIAAKIEMDSVEKGRGSVVENGGTYEPGKPQDTPVSMGNRGEDGSKMEGLLGSNKREEFLAGDAKEEFPSLKMESGTVQVDVDLLAEGKIEQKRSGVHEVENHLEEKYQVDLMKAPPPTRSSPGREGDGDFAAGADQMSIIISNGKATGLKDKEVGGNAGDEGVKMEAEGERRRKSALGGGDGKGMGLEIGLEKGGDGGGMMKMMMMGNNASSSSGCKGNPQPKQQPPPLANKYAPSVGPLNFTIPVAGWPGGLPPMGYMPPLPGVVAVDGSTVASAPLQPPQLLFSQPHPKRCTTHCYIARNISYHQQMARIPLWPPAAGSVPIYGAKPCNVNMIPSVDPDGNVSTRSVNAVVEKGQNLGLFPGHSGKDEASQTTSGLEALRKPVLLQQAIQPGAPGNILHGPAFIFPLSQQHAATAAASARSGSSKSLNINNATSTAVGAVGSASASSSVAAATGAAAAMGFSYPNMPGGETQYLAILQNNSYPYPLPAHIGAAPAYRGTHQQAVPFYNGPFYPSQMLHPSQLPQQVPANLPQMQQGQGHQNASISSSLSTSLKHLPNHQQRPLGSVGNGSSGSLQQGFPSGKNQPLPQTLTLHPLMNQQQLHQVRPWESEATGEDSPSTADSRIPPANLTTIYGQNFAMPIHTPNFSLMTQAPQGGPNVANSNNHSEQQQQMTPQHQGSQQSAIDSLQSQAFALSFGNMGNSASAHALNISSIAQGHTVFQSLPEASRQTYQIMAAAQNAQKKKNIRVSDDRKGAGNDASNDDNRKPLGGKSSSTVGQSIAFSKPDLMDASVSSLPGSSVVDSSVRTLNLGSVSSRGSASVMPALVNPTLGSPSPQHLQRSQQQQIIQLQKQRQFAAAEAIAARNKTPATSNGSVYSEHLGASTSSAAKYPSSQSLYPQNLIPGSGSQAQPPQWRGSTLPATSPVPSSLSPATATSSSLKLLPQQPGRVSTGQTHMSFANSNSKSGSASQGLQIPAGSQQSPSSPAVVGSPTTSVSKTTGGSPRTTTSSTGNKLVNATSSLQTPQVKNSSHSMPTHKSSPVVSGSVPSILGNRPLMASSASGTKHKLPQQQQQLSKHNLQQAQLFFSHPYVPVTPPHSTTNSASTGSPISAYYMQRRPTEQLPPGSASSLSSSAMSSLCPPATVANSVTCDPVKAATVSDLKGNNLQSQHAAQFAVSQSSSGSHQIVPTGFSYVHTVPNAVQLKPGEQKAPAGE